MFRKLFECVAVMLFCVLPVGCQAAENRLSDMTPRELSGFMIAAAMAGFHGDMNLDANARTEAGIKEAVYLESPGTSFGVHGEAEPNSVTPEMMQKYVDALRLLGLDAEAKTEDTQEG